MISYSTLRILIRHFIFTGLFFVSSVNLFGQVATAVSNTVWPKYETLDQQSVTVLFQTPTGGAVTLAGNSLPTQWTVTVNGNPANIVTTLPLTGATSYPIVNASAGTVQVAFNAARAGIHPSSWILPGDVVKISFTNAGNTLTANGVVPVLPFSEITCNNNYMADCSDVIYLSSGFASSAINCVPVNTSFWRWTYRFSLRWRNSTKFNLSNQLLNVKWNDAANTVTNLVAWHSNAGGDTWFNSDPATIPVTTAFSPGGTYPQIFLSYRTGFNPSTGLPDAGINTFIYPKGSGKCNVNAVAFPINNGIYTCNLGNNLQVREFLTYDTDDQTPGVLSSADIPPTGVAGLTTTDQVCLGTNVGTQFRDASVFNCIGNGTTLPIPAQGDNTGPISNGQRWVRIIYGGQNSGIPANNIPNIVVNSVPVTDGTGALKTSLVNNPVISAAYNTAPPVNTPPVPSTSNGYVVTGAGSLGVPDANGVIALNVPATATTSGLISQLITTSSPVGQKVGQKFYITIQYWNACNPYPGNNPVEYTGTATGQFVQIVTAPPPLATAGQAVCFGTNTNSISFTTTSPAGGPVRTGVNWYKANPQTGGTKITNPTGTNSLTFPANRYSSSGGIGSLTTANPNGAYYSLWATQLAAASTNPNAPVCESTPVEVVIFQQPDISSNRPTLSGANSVCNNTTQTYTASAPPTKTLPRNTSTNTGATVNGVVANGAIDFVTDNSWAQTFGASQVMLSQQAGTSTMATFNISPQPNPTVQRNISASFQYTGIPLVTINSPVISPNPPPALPTPYTIVPLASCPSSTTNLPVTVYGLSNGGTLNVTTQTICEGTAPRAITLSGTTGTIQSWQMQVNGGGFSDANLGTGSTINPAIPVVSGAQTTYQFYAIVKNGPCAAINSPTSTIIVNPLPSAAVLGGENTICILQSSNLSAVVTGGTAPFTLTYNAGNAGNVTINGYNSGGIIRVAPTTNTTYSLVSVTDSKGCSTPASGLSGTPQVTVKDLSAIITASQPTSLCPATAINGNQVNLQFTVTDRNRNPLTSYLVNYHDNLTPNNSYVYGPNYISGTDVTLINIASTRTFTITDVTDTQGCTTNPNTGSVTISVGVPPTAATLRGGGSICANSSSTFNLYLDITGGVRPYQVTIPGINGGNPFSYLSGDPIPVPTTSAGSINYSVTSIIDACMAPLLGNISGNPQTVTVNPIPVGNASTATAVCSQAMLNVSPSASVPSTFTWSATSYTGGITGPASGTGSITGLVVNRTSSQQTGTFRVTPTSVTGSCVGTPFNIIQPINPEPVSGNQILTALCSPTAVVNIDPQVQGVNRTGGNSVASTFTWTGSYGGLTGGAANGNGNITGFTLTNATTASIDAMFTVTPTATTGNCIGSAFTIRLPINPLANITTQPVADTKCAGQNSSFSVEASGPSLSYQWQVSTNGGTTWASLINTAQYSNVTTPTLNITNVPTAFNNNQYRAVVTTLTNSVSCPTNSTAATLTVNPLPTLTVLHPIFCEDIYLGGSVANIDLTRNNALVSNAPTINWFNDVAHTVSITDATSVTATNGKTYYFIATSMANCTSSGMLTYTVNPLPQAVTKNYSFCEDHVDGTPIFPSTHSYSHTGIDLTINNITIAGGSLTNRRVEWFSDVALTTPVANPTNYTLAPVFPIVTTTVYAKVTNTQTSCTNSAAVNLTILPRPNDNSPLSGNTSVCTSPEILLYQLDPQVNPGSSFIWSVVGTPTTDVNVFGGGTPASFFVLLKFPSDPGTVALTVHEELSGCAGNTQNVTLHVNQTPSPIAISGATQVCANQISIPYEVTSPNSLSAYTWSTSPGAANAGAITSNSSKINVDFGMINAVTVSVVETSSSGCVGSPARFPVNVNARPVLTPVPATILCSGQVPSVNFAVSNPVPSTFSWSVVNITGAITGVTPGQDGTGNLSNTFTAGRLQNQTGVVGSVTFNVTPTATASPFCVGEIQSVVLTINPEPVLVTPQLTTICSGLPVNYSIRLRPSNLPDGTVFSWPVPTISSGPAQGSAINNVNVPITDVLTNTSALPITATYHVTPVSGAGCVGLPQNIVVTVNPQPAINTITSTVCSGSPTGLAFTKSAGSPDIFSYNLKPATIPSELTYSGNAPIPFPDVRSTTYISNDSYINKTLNPLVVQYTVVPVTSEGCSGNDTHLNITINPQPTLSSLLNKNLCSRTPVGLTLGTADGSVPASGYKIVDISLEAIGNASQTNNTVAANYFSNDVFTNTTNTALSVVYQVAPVSTFGNLVCTGDSKPVTMTIQPEPVIATTLNTTICSRQPTNLVLSTNPTSISAASYNVTSISSLGLVSPSPNTNATVLNGIVAPTRNNYLSSDVFTNTTNSALPVLYTVVGVSGANCVGQPQTITVTVNPEPVVGVANPTVCSGAVTGLVLSTNGTSVGAASYNVSFPVIAAGLTGKSGNATLPTNADATHTHLLEGDTYFNTTANALTVAYTVAPVGPAALGGCLGQNQVIRVTVNPEPVLGVITSTVCSRIASGLVLNTNGTSVAATSYDITAVSLDNGLSTVSAALVPALPVDNPANNLLSKNYLSNDQYSNIGKTPLHAIYKVTPISSANCRGSSADVTLTVNPEPVLATPRPEICSGSASKFTLNTNGLSVDAANYNINLVSPIAQGLTADANNATFPLDNKVIPAYLINDKYTNTGNTQLAVAYAVVPISASIIGGGGSCLGQSQQITFLINPEPVLQIRDSTVCSGVPIALKLKTNGISVAAATYDITNKSALGDLIPRNIVTVPTPINSPVSNPKYLATDTYVNKTSLPLNVTYTSRGISSKGCTGQPVTTTIVINPEPILANLNTRICSNTITGLTLAPSSTSVGADRYNIANLTLETGLSADGLNAPLRNGASNTYLSGNKFINITANALVADYSIAPVSAAGCVGASTDVLLTINPEPVLNSPDKTICSNTATGLTLSTAAATASNYNITNQTIAFGLTHETIATVPANVATNGVPNSPYLATDKFVNTTTTPLNVTYTIIPVSSNSCVGATKVVTITVNPEPVILPTTTSVCSRSATGLTLNTQSNSVAATGYYVRSIPIGNASLSTSVSNAGVNITDPGVSNVYLKNDKFVNTTNFPQAVMYVIAPINKVGLLTCVGQNETITVTINPEPVGSTFTDPLCASTLNHSITSQIANGVDATFKYTVFSTNNVGVPAAPNRTINSPSNIQDTYNNSTGNLVTITYTITPSSTANGCVGQPFNYFVVIGTSPVGSNKTEAALCSHNSFNINPQDQITNGVTSTFSWSAVHDSGLTGGKDSGNGNIVENLTNKTTTVLNATYTIFPANGPCPGLTYTIIQPINPEPVINTLPTKTVCSNNAGSPNPIGVVLTTDPNSVAAAGYDISLGSKDASLTGLPTTGTSLGAEAIKNDAFNNVGAGSPKVVYQITPKSAIGCAGDAFNLSITVNPEPVVAMVSNAFCSRDASRITLTTNGSSIGALTYTLSSVTFPNTTITANPSNAVIGSTNGISLIASDSYINATNRQVAVTYNILGTSASGCKGVPQPVTAMINPEPMFAASAPDVCSGLMSGVLLRPATGSTTISKYNLNQVLTPSSGLTPFGTNAALGTHNVVPEGDFLKSDAFTNTTNAPLNVVYTLVPSTAIGCNGQPQLVTLKVNPAPALSNLNTIVCSGSTTGVTFTTTPTSVAAANTRGYNITGIAIQAGLTRTAGNTGTPRRGVENIEIIGDKFTNPTNGTLTVTYSVAPVSSAGCIGPAGSVVVTVEPTIIAVATPASLTQSICSNTMTNITLSSPSVPSTGATSISYNYTATSKISGFLSGFIPSVSNIPPGVITDNILNLSDTVRTVTYAITAVSSAAANGFGCSSQPVNFKVKVEPFPKLTPSPMVSTICSLIESNIALKSPTIPSAGVIQFNVISVVPTGGITLTSPAVAATNYVKNATLADTWNNPTTSQQTVTYTLRPVVNGGLGCVGNNTPITVNVNPLPVITATSQDPICSDGTVNVSLTSNVDGTINTWATSIFPLGSVAGAGGGSGDLILQTLHNTGSVPSTVVYTITPKAANCTNAPLIITVPVNPTPTISGLPLNQTVCYGAPLTIALASPVNGVSYTWTVDVNNSGVPLSGSSSGIGANSSTTINVAAVNNTLDFQNDFTYTITPTGPAPTFCPGVQKAVNIHAGARLSASFLSDSLNNICAETKDFLQVQLNGQSKFTLTYNDGSNKTITNVDNLKSIPITPTANVTYRLVSMTDILGCVQSLNDQVIYTVYPKLTAAFDIGSVPEFLGGNATVNFTNTSVPQDLNQFSYQWDFGVDATPDVVSGIGPNYSVNYSSPGRKIISLTVTNLSANAAGLTCYSKVASKTINILIAPVVAAFEATPLAACFPSNLTVTQNTSGGDQSNWQVTDSHSKVVGESSAPLPTFTIGEPGEYLITLTASYSKTGQKDVKTKGPFRIYDKPHAIIIANPQTVYVPDTPVTLINNSVGAEEYIWDFGDGNTSTDFQPSHNYKYASLFTLQLIASYDRGNGIVCRDTTQQNIVAKQGGVVRAPNAFTPSAAGPSGGISGGTNDANNQIFLPQVKGVEEFNMQIYDRWGNIVFESNSQTIGWDGYDLNGRLMHAGVYVYKLTLRLSDQQRTTQVGDITLIR